MQEVTIRKYKAKDREALRGIAYQTAFMGQSADKFFDGKEGVCDALTLYYTDYEPESVFIAQTQGKTVGYLTGTKDKAASKKIFWFRIFPRVFFYRVIMQGAILKKKNLKFAFYFIRSFIRGELFRPKFTKEPRATLHINVKKGFTGLGIGTLLMKNYIDYLKKQKVKLIHITTTSDKSIRFFEKQGFELLHKSRRSYFRYILGRDISSYLYARKI
jgi:GNAT superfamily N-acetyltransferase